MTRICSSENTHVGRKFQDTGEDLFIFGATAGIKRGAEEKEAPFPFLPSIRPERKWSPNAMGE
jgi:hypothetical protein